MRNRSSITRRDFLRSTGAFGGMVGLAGPDWYGGLGAASAKADTPRTRKPGNLGIVHVIVFSNFEGWLENSGPAVRWFEACSQAHPSILWTHMYSPRYLVVPSPEMVKAEAQFSPFLLKSQASGAEVGLHLHLFYDLVRQLGVGPRAYPFASDATADCNQHRTIEQDSSQGYDVLITGYTPQEQSRLLDASIKAFRKCGFGQPKTFCAGYSSANPAFQALLTRKGFKVSFAAQVIHQNQYGRCWHRLLDWPGHITPLTIPYRVSRTSILPPPHGDARHLDLIEVPLNLGVDLSGLYLSNQRVSRLDIFDRHYGWVDKTGKETAVAIGVHADVIGLETWGNGPVSQLMDGFLKHVAERAKGDSVEIRYGIVSDVAKHFQHNTSIGQIDQVY